MNPGKSVKASIEYEVGLENGPRSITIKGEQFYLATGQDIAVLRRVTYFDGKTIDEKIVGVIGSECSSDASEFLNVVDFLRNGGVIGLHRTLVR